MRIMRPSRGDEDAVRPQGLVLEVNVSEASLVRERGHAAPELSAQAGSGLLAGCADHDALARAREAERLGLGDLLQRPRRAEHARHADGRENIRQRLPLLLVLQWLCPPLRLGADVFLLPLIARAPELVHPEHRGPFSAEVDGAVARGLGEDAGDAVAEGHVLDLRTPEGLHRPRRCPPIHGAAHRNLVRRGDALRGPNAQVYGLAEGGGLHRNARALFFHRQRRVRNGCCKCVELVSVA
mmetsp:Transcript_43824/g.137676  ORF Transcript_43824/g.137676 Transcript_43824/m.137676 type:complete len:240 (-) Transcript_43824:2768-3487(-)